jgi:hypothetical protein
MKAVKNALRLTAFVALFPLLPEPASGQNTFQQITESSPGNGRYFLTEATNWSGGVLPDTTPGVINAGTDGFLDTATGWDVTQNGSTIGISGAGTSTTITDSTWVINGGTLGNVSTSVTATASGTSLVTVNSGGTLQASAGRDIIINSNNTGSATVTLNGGLMTAGDQIWLNQGGVINGTGTITAGDIEVMRGSSISLTNSTITLTNNFGGRAANDNVGGTVTLTNSVLTAGTFKVLDGAANADLQLNLAGAAGSATFGDWATSGTDATADENILIDFASGTGMTLTMTSPSRALTLASGSWTAGQWAEALWTNDQLTYNGLDSGDYGDWATVTTTGFGDGNLFDLSGGTLSVTAIPEPGSFGLVALGLAVLFGLRRSSTHR